MFLGYSVRRVPPDEARVADLSDDIEGGEAGQGRRRDRGDMGLLREPGAWFWMWSVPPERRRVRQKGKMAQIELDRVGPRVEHA
jgi:hypothetical protein